MSDDSHVAASTTTHARLTPPHILQQLQSIRQQLIDAGVLDAASYSAGQLGSLLFRIEDLQVGQPARIPWLLLNDFSLGGPAHIIVRTVLEYAKRQGWTEIEIHDGTFSGLQDELVQVTESLRPSPPRIYISPIVSVSSNVDEIVQRLRGQIVDFSQATHIVDTGHAAVTTTVRHRIVQRSATHALLHLCQRPRNLRRWIPLKDIPADAFDDSNGAGVAPNPDSEPIRISLDWILLSGDAGEWLDENDFVLSDADPSVIKLTRKNGTFAIQGVSGPIAKASPDGNAAQPSKKRRSSATADRPPQSFKKFRITSPQVMCSLSRVGRTGPPPGAILICRNRSLPRRAATVTTSRSTRSRPFRSHR